MEKTQQRYNEIPYLSKAFEFTQPVRQKSVLELLGMKTGNLSKAKILEIGCSYGGNILNTAVYYPNCNIVGIDLSEEQVKEGNRIIEEIGLENIKLYNKDIMDYKCEFGKFDYIICHGVYSWVKEEVRSKILEVVKKSLKKNGSALISYNTYPGWKNLDILKDIMSFRVKMLRKNGRQIAEKDVVKYGRGSLEFVENFMSDEVKEIKELSKHFIEQEDYYLYHEMMEENNKAIYLYEFNKKLEEHGLVHVINSKLGISNRALNDKELLEEIQMECESDHVAREQYFDYLYNTNFRYSVITHKDNLEKLSVDGLYEKKNLDNLHLKGYYVYNEEKDSYTFNKIELKKECNEVIKELNNIYPSTIQVKELVKKLGDECYIIVASMINEEMVHYGTEKEKININKKKIKISDKFRKYFEVVLKNRDKITGATNYGSNVPDILIQTILLFDGKRTKEEVKRHLEEYNTEGIASEELINSLVEDAFYEILIMNQYEGD